MLVKAQVVLKKETLESYGNSLQKALRFLDSAVQLHLASSIKLQLKLIAAKITNVWNSIGLPPIADGGSHTTTGDEDEKAINKDKEPAERPSNRKTHGSLALRGRTKQHSNALLRLLGLHVIEYERQSSTNFKTKSPNDQKHTESRPSLHKSKAWDIQLLLACSGWTTHLRQYVVLSSQSKIFELVRDGTLEQLRRLFDEGRASPYSMDEDGYTLLHWAMAFRWGLVPALVEMGVDDFHAETLSNLTPSDMTYCCAEQGIGNASGWEFAVHRSMLIHGVYDKFQTYPAFLPGFQDRLYNVVVVQMVSSLEIFESFLAHVFPNFYHWPLQTRIDMVTESLFPNPAVDSRAVKRFLDPEGHVHPEHLAYRNRSKGITLFELITYRYFQRDVYYSIRRRRQDWLRMISDPVMNRV
ncbi:hypothetical protein N658DRAFT_211431 [Parathielavia hyrcaniae]|uniref:Uncharacterized protein n=1 Tax=Parathielavia hyrcaniae TaxID=113614 RepID=A0AAN6PVP1_9PEZI|nr:hypothetical protein N658DRAFT_211431 [Parathielavia hyrcaniae]